MNGIKIEPGEADWTRANLQKLLVSLKTSISERDRMINYTKGLKTVDWKKVAFPPFSPKACQRKWREILQQICKSRTLTDIIVEAEASISTLVLNSTKDKQHGEDAEGPPPKPPFGYNLFCKEHTSFTAGVSKSVSWQRLTKSQREEYCARCRELKRQFLMKLNKYVMTLDEEEQEEILYHYGITRHKLRRQVNRLEKVKISGEPKMPCRNANVIYCKKQMIILKEKFPNSTERFSKCNQKWCELSNKKKEFYKEKVKENFRKYTQELQKWFMTLTSPEQEDYLASNPSKHQYLAKKMKFNEREEPCVYIPSDSEDEEILNSSSDEEEDNLDFIEEEEEEEEEEDGFMFEMC